MHNSADFVHVPDVEFCTRRFHVGDLGKFPNSERSEISGDTGDGGYSGLSNGNTPGPVDASYTKL